MRLIGVVIADTNRAFYFQDWYWHGPDWIPKSQAEIIRDPDTFEVTITLSNWISEKKPYDEFQEVTEHAE